MSDCLIMAWPVRDAIAMGTAARIEAALARDARVEIIRASGMLIATWGTPAVQVAPSTFLVGELFGAPAPVRAASAQPAGRTDFEDYCSALLSTHWGSYIALRHDPLAARFLSVFAEPIGSREIMHWSHRGVTILSSDAERWVDAFPPADLGLCLEDIAHIIHYPSQAAETMPLRGIASLQPGAVTYFAASGTTARRLWKPADHCGAGDTAEDAAKLAGIIDACVGAWSSICVKPIVELSGGLDSAIVAASLRQARHDDLAAFTFFSDSLAGDERRFSRAIAEQLKLIPHEMAFRIAALDERILDSAAVGMRPGIGSTSFFHDEPLAHSGAAQQADALFTGRGGDALFFQHPTPLVARGGWQGERRSLVRLEALARWCQISIWQALFAIHGPSMPAAARDLRQSRFCAATSAARASTWAGPLEGVAAGKKMQIEAIAGDRNAFGPSRCAGKMRVIHPLLSQPIVEYVLSRSLMALTEGRRDRAMARAAFAQRLPDALVARRGKGALSSFFGQTLARSVPLLRSRLLEGALAQAGLIERVRLEQALGTDHLIQSNCYGEIIRLLIVERWMRGWRERPRPVSPDHPPEATDCPPESRSRADKSPADFPGCR